MQRVANTPRTLPRRRFSLHRSASPTHHSRRPHAARSLLDSIAQIANHRARRRMHPRLFDPTRLTPSMRFFHRVTVCCAPVAALLFRFGAHVRGAPVCSSTHRVRENEEGLPVAEKNFPERRHFGRILRGRPAKASHRPPKDSRAAVVRPLRAFRRHAHRVPTACGTRGPCRTRVEMPSDTLCR